MSEHDSDDEAMAAYRAEDQIPALYAAAQADPAFMAWLNEFIPDGGWRLEYSGEIVGLHAAWLAGAEHQRTEDLSNTDPAD